MKTVTARIIERYDARREVSQPADLITLLLARLKYVPPSRRTDPIKELEANLQQGSLEGLSGNGDRKNAFARWLYDYLTINDTVKGISFYPIHPALSLSTNGEGSRVEGFVQAVASRFTWTERNTFLDRLWTTDGIPPFERMIHNLIDWQPQADAIAPDAEESLFQLEDRDEHAPLSPVGILEQTKRDLLALSEVMVSIQSFISHAGRLMAFALSRYLLAQSGEDFATPIFAAPAADSHEGVKTLAHEMIEMHQARFEQALEKQFRQAVDEALAEYGWTQSEDPEDETTAREIVRNLFHARANVVPPGRYEEMHEDFGSLTNMAYHYYWTQSYARSRFLRQLHASYLNLAKKAGFANSRSRYSRWHFYWLAPSLIETLLLIARAHSPKDRVLMVDLFDQWHVQYGLAVLISPRWEDVYRRYFRSFGNPESLNEANQRRFVEILAERGRLYKNSDDFPWVVLRD